MQSQFFGGLLDARRKAADARTADARIRAFDADALTRSLDHSIERIVVEWPDKRDSVRRALRAELVERVNGYRAAIGALSDRAADAMSADDPSRLETWRAWTTQLANTFDAADRAWMSLRSVVDALPPKR